MENNDGSLFKVPLTKILAINPHGNAERLEIATVYGFQVIISKGQYSVGEEVLYVPVDSILSQWLEDALFPIDSKVKLTKHRVRQIKLRGLASQGLLVSPKVLLNPISFVNNVPQLEQDYAEQLGITKYQPPVSGPSSTIGKDKQRNKKYSHPQFHSYNGVSNIKWFPNIFDGHEVVIQEKLHGTNARAAILPFIPRSLFEKVKAFLGIAPESSKVYGSNNVDITSKGSYTGFYDDDVYGNTFKELSVFSKLKFGEIVYGEIIGPGLQKNYDYGLTEYRFVLFDVKVLMPNGSFMWMNPDEVEMYAKCRGFEFVPVLYKGEWDKDKAYELTKGASVYAPSQTIREGCVIKKRYDYSNEGNKSAFKWISESYLDDKTNTDEH